LKKVSDAMLVAGSKEELSSLVACGTRFAVTIGNFDGVHMGHRELLRVTREKAAARSAALGQPIASVLVTFDPHPVHVVRPAAGPGILTPLPRKLELLEQTGLDATLVLPFTRETAATPAEDFTRTVLVDVLHATDLVIGYNFALGKGREGNDAMLRELGERCGFSVTQIQPVIVGGETVSSSRIREHIRCGNMENAIPLLGRMHSVEGTVIHGRARGRELGFPTANIEYRGTLLPPLGAYATWLQILPDGTEYHRAAAQPLQSMTSVGTNPTIGGSAITLEAHALDFSGDLYGKRVRLHFASRLREEVAFKNAEDLVAQLHLDAASTRDTLLRSKDIPLI
jgi:riboflavin kinase/FMN adenylyltransferase